eukprot:gene17649-23994_t
MADADFFAMAGWDFEGAYPAASAKHVKAAKLGELLNRPVKLAATSSKASTLEQANKQAEGKKETGSSRPVNGVGTASIPIEVEAAVDPPGRMKQGKKRKQQKSESDGAGVDVGALNTASKGASNNGESEASQQVADSAAGQGKKKKSKNKFKVAEEGDAKATTPVLPSTASPQAEEAAVPVSAKKNKATTPALASAVSSQVEVAAEPVSAKKNKNKFKGAEEAGAGATTPALPSAASPQVEMGTEAASANKNKNKFKASSQAASPAAGPGAIGTNSSPTPGAAGANSSPAPSGGKTAPAPGAAGSNSTPAPSGGKTAPAPGAAGANKTPAPSGGKTAPAPGAAGANITPAPSGGKTAPAQATPEKVQPAQRTPKEGKNKVNQAHAGSGTPRAAPVSSPQLTQGTGAGETKGKNKLKAEVGDGPTQAQKRAKLATPEPSTSGGQAGDKATAGDKLATPQPLASGGKGTAMAKLATPQPLASGVKAGAKLATPQPLASGGQAGDKATARAKLATPQPLASGVKAGAKLATPQPLASGGQAGDKATARAKLATPQPSASGGKAGGKETASQGESKAVSRPAQSESAPQQQGQAKSAAASSSLFGKMRARLQGGQFRFLNEALYTRSGDDALGMMQKEPELFEQYHDGFKQQTLSWPKQPQDVAIEFMKAKPADLVKVHSFDLVASAPGVIACNMAAVPLENASVDVAIFSLALMGIDYGKFLAEAARVVRHKGWLWIAEVRSRFVADPKDGKQGDDFAPFLKVTLEDVSKAGGRGPNPPDGDPTSR